MRIVASDFSNPLVIDLLRTHVATARADGLTRLSLETGSWPYFHPAQRFYKGHGFAECGPFGDYVLDPNSVFMSLDLTAVGVVA